MNNIILQLILYQMIFCEIIIIMELSLNILTFLMNVNLLKIILSKKRIKYIQFVKISSY